DQPVTALDQMLGTGDGAKAAFQLVKTYGDAAASNARRIAKPVAGSVTIAVDGEVMAGSAYDCDVVAGIVTFRPGSIPAAGARVTACFEFDVPVRFATGRIDVNLT
ncbi:DUF2460 domain-containing protein, partial [Pseudomonas sp. SIMBA_044]|uniref:DUF2460 domain-containing protein n=1 Tax=Pseudomonas sp. SIMBA_044 TaxID=3085785 RepID=UPI003979A90B